MTMRIAQLMILIAGFAGAYVSLAGNVVEDPSIRLTCRKLELTRLKKPVHGYFHQMCFRWNIVRNSSAWNMAWCDKEKARVTVTDSTGNKADAGTTWLFTLGDPAVVSWHRVVPAAGSQWVSMKGEVPVAVSLKDADSGAVTVKLVEGFSAPVVLKGAGLAGEGGKPADVKATLKVINYESAKEEGKKRLYLQLSSNGPLGVRGFELQTVKGQPVITEPWGSGEGRDGDIRSWDQALQLDDVPEGELKVTVRYASEPRQVMAVVDTRATLSGFCSGEEEGVGGPAKAELKKSVAAGSPPASGQESAVKAELVKVSIGSEVWMMNNAPRVSPLQLGFDVRLESKGADFADMSNPGEQSLEVTDSTGRVLKPAILRHGWKVRDNDGYSGMVVSCKVPEMATPGAEWVRVKGTLLVPMGLMKESPVYELPLAKGAELHVPVPGMEKPVNEGGDVVTAGDAPTCRLRLEEVEGKGDGVVQVKICLQGNVHDFEFEDFELVDGKGKPLEADYEGGSSTGNDIQYELSRTYSVRNASAMKHLRVKMKYMAELGMETVPVDMTVGLGGVVAGHDA